MEYNNVNAYAKTASELRYDARNSLRGLWGTSVLLCLVFGLITSLSGIPVAGQLILLLITGPLNLGLTICFVNLVRQNPFRLEDLFNGFKNFTSSFVLFLLTTIFTTLWTFLFIIPGIIARYRYAMAYYILNDNPDMSANEAIKQSSLMMKGHKWRLFCLHLSFIGWILLCTITIVGIIGLLWVIPYMKTAETCFYENLKAIYGDVKSPEESTF